MKNAWGVTFWDDLKGTANRQVWSLHAGVGFLKEWHIVPPHFLVHVCVVLLWETDTLLWWRTELSENRVAVTPAHHFKMGSCRSSDNSVDNSTEMDTKVWCQLSPRMMCCLYSSFEVKNLIRKLVPLFQDGCGLGQALRTDRGCWSVGILQVSCNCFAERVVVKGNLRFVFFSFLCFKIWAK